MGTMIRLRCSLFQMFLVNLKPSLISVSESEFQSKSSVLTAVSIDVSMDVSMDVSESVFETFDSIDVSIVFSSRDIPGRFKVLAA